MKFSKALVLGGGGVAGSAWEIGILAGLSASGVEVLDADLIVGTSAGSLAGALITSGTDIEDLYSAQFDSDENAYPTLDIDVPGIIGGIRRILDEEPDPLIARRRIGAIALAANAMSDGERRKLTAARLPRQEWPTQDLRITAIDANSGELTVFTRDSGVTLVDAVSASCAVPGVWPTTPILGTRYMDGGMRSGTNIDVADGYNRILVFKATDIPEAADVRSLNPRSSVRIVELDEASQIARGDNPLDPAVRSQCAKAGYEQGGRLAAEIKPFWLGQLNE